MKKSLSQDETTSAVFVRSLVLAFIIHCLRPRFELNLFRKRVKILNLFIFQNEDYETQALFAIQDFGREIMPQYIGEFAITFINFVIFFFRNLTLWNLNQSAGSDVLRFVLRRANHKWTRVYIDFGRERTSQYAPKYTQLFAGMPTLRTFKETSEFSTKFSKKLLMIFTLMNTFF